MVNFPSLLLLSCCSFFSPRTSPTFSQYIQSLDLLCFFMTMTVSESSPFSKEPTKLERCWTMSCSILYLLDGFFIISLRLFFFFWERGHQRYSWIFIFMDIHCMLHIICIYLHIHIYISSMYFHASLHIHICKYFKKFMENSPYHFIVLFQFRNMLHI